LKGRRSFPLRTNARSCRPHARDRAFDIARRDPPPGISAAEAAVAVAEVLESVGDTCPECESVEEE
jgi:hypothetical protein